MTWSRKLLLAGGVILVVLLGLILWWKWEDVRELFNKGDKTESSRAEAVKIARAKKDTAKKVLDYLYYQRDSRGIYSDISRCQLDKASGSQWCAGVDSSNRAGMSVIWARWKYYQKNSALTGELDRLREDLIAYEEMLDSGEYVINNDYYNCLFMEELVNNDILGERYKNAARRVCVESVNETFSVLDDTRDELVVANAKKIKGIAQGNYDLANDEVLTEFNEFSRESGWGIGLLSRYAYYAADEIARMKITVANDDRTYQELLTQALTYYLVQKRDNKQTMEDSCAVALAIAMEDGWVADADKKRAVDNLLTSDEEFLEDTCYLAYYKAGKSLDEWQIKEVGNFDGQNASLGSDKMNFYAQSVMDGNDEGTMQIVSSNISNAIKAGMLSI